jgi:hypothetical protein
MQRADPRIVTTIRAAWPPAAGRHGHRVQLWPTTSTRPRRPANGEDAPKAAACSSGDGIDATVAMVCARVGSLGWAGERWPGIASDGYRPRPSVHMPHIAGPAATHGAYRGR